MLAERVGETLLEVLDVSVEPGGAFVGEGGPVVVTPDAAEPDGSGAAAGFHVGRFAAGAVGDGDFPDRVAGVLGFQ